MQGVEVKLDPGVERDKNEGLIEGGERLHTSPLSGL